jgi:hypothetical protein
MIVSFCERTRDIHMVLEQVEIDSARRSETGTPVLHASDKGLDFYLMNSRGRYPITVVEQYDLMTAWVKVDDIHWDILCRTGEIGYRYGDASKVMIYSARKYRA